MNKKPPVVVVLGHIDHGKSTLIDYIRKANVTAKEAGGITQSIGAYQVSVETKSGKLKTENLITFIDTPGHEAFEHMRSFGARAADIGILVIAADEGVKPQTIEAIKDIKQSNLPFIVALNKIDRPQTNVKKVKEELIQHEVFVEGFGGNVPAVEISAKTGKGVKELLDLLTLMAEVEGLSADPAKPAAGVIIVSSLDSQKGVLATGIVKDGTLKVGQWLRLQSTHGKVKALRDFEGKLIKEATPSTPVQILGLEQLPAVGETFIAVKSQDEAASELLPAHSELISNKVIPGQKVLRFVLKAKESASLDALSKLFSQVQTQYPDIALQVVTKSVGDVSTSDIEIARRFNALIVGFAIKIPSIVRPLVAQKEISIKLFSIVYDLPKIVEEWVKQSFAQEAKALEKSELAVLGAFSKSKDGQVIGGKVAKGTIKKGMLVNIKRQENIVGRGKIINLQHLKQDVSVVEAGKECGILFQGDDVAVGDVLIES